MASIEVTLTPEEDLTIFTVHGALTADEIIKYSAEQYGSNPTKLVLWDVLNGSVNNIDTQDFQKIAAAVKPYTEKRVGGKTAFVGEFDADFGMGRMYETYAAMENIPVMYRTFRDRQEALDWLLGQ